MLMKLTIVEAEAEAANFQIETIDRKNDLHIKWGLQSSQQKGGRGDNVRSWRLNVRTKTLWCSVFKPFVIFEFGFVYKWRHGLGGGGCQGFCDDITVYLVVKKSATRGVGVGKNCSKYSDVIEVKVSKQILQTNSKIFYHEQTLA